MIMCVEIDIDDTFSNCKFLSVSVPEFILNMNNYDFSLIKLFSKADNNVTVMCLRFHSSKGRDKFHILRND
jgi:hypothetical protein